MSIGLSAVLLKRKVAEPIEDSAPERWSIQPEALISRERLEPNAFVPTGKTRPTFVVEPTDLRYACPRWVRCSTNVLNEHDLDKSAPHRNGPTTLMALTSPPRTSVRTKIQRAGVRPVDTKPIDKELGPLALGLASFYLSMAFILAGPAYPFEPWLWTLSLGFPIGALLLTPRDHLRRVAFDGPVLAMAAWIALSVLWTRNPTFGVFSVRRDLPLLFAVSLSASLVPKEVAIRAIKRGLAAGVLLTIIALIIDPSTRAHGSDGIYLQAYPGWHGYFIHKNVLAPYLIFALITVLTFEKEPLKRGLWLATIGILLVGSDSATGLSAAFVIGAFWAWFRLFHRSNGRWTTAFVISSIAVGICALMGAVASLSILTSAYGKDLTFSGRTYIWSAVFNAIQDNPWVGYGIGGVFWDSRSSITRSIWRDVGFSIPHSHNGVLDVWLNFGLIGLALFAIVFISTVTMGTRLVRRSPQMGEWILLLTGAQFLIGLSENVFLGAWLVYMAVVRGVAQRELNTLAREDVLEIDDSTSSPSEDPVSVLDPRHRRIID